MRKSRYQNEGQPKIYGEMQFGINMFFSEGSYSFRCFESDGELIPDPRRSDIESTFTQVKFCFWHNKLLWN